MGKVIFLPIVLSMLFVVPSAIAYQQGDMVLTLAGSGSSDESLDGTVFNIEGGLGYFMTQNLEVIWRQGISYADIPGEDDWNAATRL